MREKIVLLVEDNPDDEALALRAFQRLGINCRVVVAHDGQEALDFLFGLGNESGRESSLTPALILLDIKLPRIDGIEVLKRLFDYQWARLIPIVMLTSSSEEKDLVDSYRYGANSYLLKPVVFEEFMEVINVVGNYWLVMNELPRGREID